MPFFTPNRSSKASDLRLFFATDVHGSDLCFRKFLNAGRFYRADVLVMGGDITGKTLVLIEQSGQGFRARVGDHDYSNMTNDEMLALCQAIRDRGQYPYVGDRSQLDALADEDARDRVFRQVVVENLRRWVELAEQRLRETGIRCFITPGNDDFWEVDQALEHSDLVEFPEGRCVRIDERHEMITTGYSNITPWHSPRELDEDALYARIDQAFSQVERPETLIAVLHAPPYNTSLDQAPRIDADFRPRMSPGRGLEMTGVGSTAVRKFIEQRQPLCSLHGHVHESRGIDRIGRTICINPGSEYADGTLCGALLTFRDGALLASQLLNA